MKMHIRLSESVLHEQQTYLLFNKIKDFRLGENLPSFCRRQIIIRRKAIIIPLSVRLWRFSVGKWRRKPTRQSRNLPQANTLSLSRSEIITRAKRDRIIYRHKTVRIFHPQYPLPPLRVRVRQARKDARRHPQGKLPQRRAGSRH